MLSFLACVAEKRLALLLSEQSYPVAGGVVLGEALNLGQ